MSLEGGRVAPRADELPFYDKALTVDPDRKAFAGELIVMLSMPSFRPSWVRSLTGDEDPEPVIGLGIAAATALVGHEAPIWRDLALKE